MAAASARAGYTGVLGSGAWEAPLYAGDGRNTRREKELGPRPEMWDAYLGKQAAVSADGRKHGLRWEDMKVRYQYPFVFVLSSS